jgi:hypothetical protein
MASSGPNDPCLGHRPRRPALSQGKGKEAKLAFMGHALMENRNGLVVGAVATRASGHAERLAALALIRPHAEPPQPVTLGADKGHDSADFVEELREQAVTPHLAQNPNGRRSAIDGRTTRHPGYAISQRIEEVFGWAKTVAGLRKMRHRGLPKVDWQFILAPPTTSSACPNCSPQPRRDPFTDTLAAPSTALHPRNSGRPAAQTSLTRPKELAQNPETPKLTPFFSNLLVHEQPFMLRKSAYHF